MTQIIKENRVSPVTVLDITDNYVAKKLIEADKYFIIVGSGKKRRVTKSLQGQYKELGYVPIKVRKVEVTKEVFDTYKVSDSLSKNLKLENKVDITGKSKGKGFQGVVKRYDFKGGPKTHGQKHSHRGAGSIGAQKYNRVFKGMRMAGRMGNDKITLKNRVILDIKEIENRVYALIKGALPGSCGDYLEIKIIN